MKMTVITGSPRKNGNSFAMTDAFIRAARELGHSVERFDAAFLQIGGCHACMTCYKTGKACSFNGEFDAIASSILTSDAVVFTMPVYWYSIPAQIKAVIDCLFSLVVGGKSVAGKKCALIACCEEEEMTVLDGVRIPMERTAALLQWEMVGEVLIPGVLNEGDIDRTDGCRQAAELARKF
ncbi:flavodoxin [Alistipes sp. An116]|uniref:flavodoxin family protein n=1 Tax=Alistipes sp. An116 TaxID=1965546 RepID=UPI000B3768B6|nr:flavodoxin family protein [Alistipes sp. An116]OUQ53185.1 flavodoxin [Alistipes sp. An116]